MVADSGHESLRCKAVDLNRSGMVPPARLAGPDRKAKKDVPQAMPFSARGSH